MDDFLFFLNTADITTLTKIPGVTRPIAGNIIAARPFDFVEDCAKVQKVGKNLLGKMQSYFEAELNESRKNSLVPVGGEPLGIPEPVHSYPEEKTTFLSRFGRAFGNFMRALLRLVLIILVIGGFGAALYYGLPFLNKTFIAPVERNTARVSELEGEIAALRSELIEMNGRVSALESSVDAHSASLAKLTEMQAALEGRLGENNDQAQLELKHEVMMTRVLDMLGRARLYLSQSNFGLAREDVKDARDLLAQLQSETEQPQLAQVIDRLDLALGNLPAFPVVASADLEIAWQMLMTGAPANAAAETPTPAALPTYTPILDPLETLTATPAPIGTPTGTP
ncbi:MAG: helix-hairpin-helix domain-containing protein [Chloroflexi bacterium]|nr:helix-hairpin-helix domain-containing protein [Chloroflexota bacterium]